MGKQRLAVNLMSLIATLLGTPLFKPGAGSAAGHPRPAIPLP